MSLRTLGIILLIVGALTSNMLLVIVGLILILIG